MYLLNNCSYRRKIMFKWISKLFTGTSVPEVINSTIPPELGITPAKITAPKKTATKKAVKVDLNSMKKDELLAHAKKNGVKANASMNKVDILKAIKNG